VVEAPGIDGDLRSQITHTFGKLVRENVPFREEVWSVDEAGLQMTRQHWRDGAALLRSTRMTTTTLVTCGSVYAFGIGPLLPSADKLAGVNLLPHPSGMLIDFGPALAAHLFGGREGQVKNGIAGPSSSGKTTFIKRLSVQLEVNGVHPKSISLDDYYVDRTRTPKDENGEWDFEALEALDLPLFQSHLARLAKGELVKTPRFDFKLGKSIPEGGPELVLGPNDVLLIEGIHGLNPALYGDAVKRDSMLLIFIHPQSLLPLDRLTTTAAADLRLVRRIVRDRHQRNYKASENIARWASVRRGEMKHIFPWYPQADIVFDTGLVYELGVLKVYAERYLLEVAHDDPAYGTAYRLRRLVDAFVAIYPDQVPPTSICREFIGGSGFEY
jgi:uridine kinase